jgi:hypothetical protein
MNTSSENTISNPYLPGLRPMLGITALGLLGFLLTAGLAVAGIVPMGALMLAGLPAALFGVISILVALAGERQVRQIRDFLDSDRPQVRWTYTLEEWDALRESAWQEANQERFLPLGGLAFLLGLAGLLAGGAIGADDARYSLDWWEKLLEIGVAGLLGALAGAAIGAALGAIVTLGNWQTARQAYRQTQPGAVALSAQEIYALGQYANLTDTLQKVTWETAPPARLLITFTRWQTRRSAETWEILVPERVRAQVAAVTQKMKVS